MTHDEFTRAYDVHKLIAEGQVRSFFGRSRTSKVVVLLHHLDGGDTPENAARLARVAALAGEGGSQVLDVCEVEGTPVVVTRFILNFTTFDAWLAAESPTPAASKQPVGGAPGDFTSQFGQQKPRPDRLPSDISTDVTVPLQRVEPPPSARQPGRPPEKTPPAPAPTAPPGEFTKLFRPPGHPPAEPRPASQAAAPPSPTPATGAPGKKGMGEFTRLFGAPMEAAPPATSAPAPAAGPASPPPGGSHPGPGSGTPAARKGDFTALFGKPVTPDVPTPPPARLQESPAPWPAPAPERAAFPEPQVAEDDLSRRLRGTAEPPLAPSAPPPPMPAFGVPAPEAPKPGAPGDFTRVFGAPPPEPPMAGGPQIQGPGPAPVLQPPQPAPGAGAPPQPAADYQARLQGTPLAPAPVPPAIPSPVSGGGIASEFTRALRRLSASVLRPPVEPEKPAAEAPPGAPPSALPWVFAILGVLAVVAVGIVLYFVLTAG